MSFSWTNVRYIYLVLLKLRNRLITVKFKCLEPLDELLLDKCTLYLCSLIKIEKQLITLKFKRLEPWGLYCVGPVLSYKFTLLIFFYKQVSFHSDYLHCEEAYNGWRANAITFYSSSSHNLCTQGTFLPFADAVGLISSLSMYACLEQACQIVCLISN